MKKSLYLLAFRGAGKSFLARELAKRLFCKSVDLDAELEKRLGKSIVAYVEESGMEAFRKAEAEVLAEFDAEFRHAAIPGILSTGGGVVDWAPSREILAKSTHARVYLRTPAPLLWQRLKEHPERLKIRNLDSEERLAAVLGEREPFYRLLATHELPNEDLAATLTALEQLCLTLWQQ